MPELSKFVPDFISVRRVQAIGIGIICSYVALVRGGVYLPLLWPVVLGIALVCGGLLFLEKDCRQRIRARIFRDPVFYLGLIFLLLLLLQFINSGYELVAAPDGSVAFTKRPPKLWPWAINAAESAEMLVWFFTPWVIVLLIRNVFTRFHLKMMLSSLVWTAAAVAGIGILEALLGMTRMFGMVDSPGNNFFATFDYSNHAAEWLYLNACLAGGMAYDAMKRRRPPMQQISWYASFLLCVAAGILTSSRVGALISVLLLGISLYLFLGKVLLRVRGAAATNIYLGAGIIILIGVTLFFGAGGGRLADELKEKSMAGDYSLAHDLGGRLVQLPPALSIIGDYPLFGAGGSSYQWLAQLHVDESEWARWDDFRKTHVHCDPIQFFSEFGLLGMSCLTGIVAILFTAFYKTGMKGGVTLWISAGLVIILLHSLIDPAFRCPAILFEWCLLLAALPRLTKQGRDWPDPMYS